MLLNLLTRFSVKDFNSRSGLTNLNIRRPLTAIEEEEDLQRALELSRLANTTPVTPVFEQDPDSEAASWAYQAAVSFAY